MNTFEEGLRKDTLGFLRGSIFFRNRIVSYHHVKIAKINGEKEGNCFSHLSIVIGKSYFFLKSDLLTDNGLHFEYGNVKDIQLSNEKDIGISMFEGTEVTFAGNYILSNFGNDKLIKTIKLLLCTICDSLKEAEILEKIGEINGEEFIYQTLRVAKSKIVYSRFCQII